MSFQPHYPTPGNPAGGQQGFHPQQPHQQPQNGYGAVPGNNGAVKPPMPGYPNGIPGPAYQTNGAPQSNGAPQPVPPQFQQPNNQQSPPGGYRPQGPAPPQQQSFGGAPATQPPHAANYGPPSINAPPQQQQQFPQAGAPTNAIPAGQQSYSGQTPQYGQPPQQQQQPPMAGPPQQQADGAVVQNFGQSQPQPMPGMQRPLAPNVMGGVTQPSMAGFAGAPPVGVSSMPGAFQSPSGPGNFQPVPASVPTGYPAGPGGPVQGGFPPGPGGPAPGGFPPGPGGPAQGGFPPGPASGGFPPGPGGFPPVPGGPGPGGFPPGAVGPGSGGFPSGPGGPAPGGFQPGPGGPAPGGFPPGPGGFPGAPGGAPGMPGNYPGQQRQPQRLDPNMMPSAVAVMEDDAVRAGRFPTGYPHAEAPPLVSTNFFVQDQGNCNPRLMRSTLYVAPTNSDMLKATQLPFAVACSPFAKLHESEYAPPVIDLGPGGPVRCQRCKAYICPFMEFQDGGRRFRCPFCHASTPVEDVYFAHLDHTGRRTDIEHRPELFLGAYEFLATKQYCKNGLAPKEPAYIFMVDVSYNAVQNGMLHVICRNLERVLSSLPRETGQSESSIRIGLATFDQAVHFYDLSSPQPNMMVVGDVTEMFVPIVEGLLLPYSQAADNLRAVLSEIPLLFAQNKTTETMLGPVVNAGLDALKCSDRAGKLFIFSTSLPTMEAPGKLKATAERNLLGTDKEKTVLTPQCDFYTKTGEQCVKSGVTVDLFLFPNAHIDVATIAQLSAVTGGAVYKYQYFTPEKDAARFLSDLQHDVSRQIGFDCMVRIRSSAGIRPVTFSGSFYMENATDLEMASIDEDKAFIAELKHDDKLSDPNAIIQCAVLYTSITGQRRLRILNLCLAVSNDFTVLYRSTDFDTLCTFLLRTAVQLNREKGNKEMRDTLGLRSAQILATYREKCSTNAPLGQLILPENLKLLPLFTNSIIKNDAISGGSEMTIDDKAWMIEFIRGLTVADTMRLLYPRVYPVSELEVQDPAELTTLPPAVRASVDFLSNDKAFLIDNGIMLFLWVGLGVPEVWVREVFGANSVTHMDAESHVIPEKDNGRSRGLRRAIQLLGGGARNRKMYIIREKDALEPWMRKYLVEDKGPNSMSYVDFLCHVHREIRNILS